MGINIAVVGLRFGEAFLRIYADHPMVEKVRIYDINPNVAQQMKEKYRVDRVYGSFEELLADDEIQGVHLVTPIPFHTEQTIQVLESGKHCACAVTMAETLEDLKRIVDTVYKTGQQYMMMETSLYTYHSFYIRQMIAEGRMGKIQFMRGSYYQDFAGLPEVWKRIPPMMYATHAIAPLADFAGAKIHKVTCHGVGKMADNWKKEYDNPWPMEYAMLEFENGLKAAVEKSMYELAKAYQEAVYVYGQWASFEWGLQNEDFPFVTFREDISKLPLELHAPHEADMRMNVKQIELPNPYKRLPKELWKYTGKGAGHHGAHPHMVHEFVTSIIEERKPYADVEMAANITAAGICAHQSALQDGAVIQVPTFEKKENEDGIN